MEKPENTLKDHPRYFIKGKPEKEWGNSISSIINNGHPKGIEDYLSLFRNQHAIDTAGKLFMQASSKSGNKTIPAAYTYLGQFIMHDLSFSLDNLNDFDATTHESTSSPRTASLDLDLIYGRGPLVDHYLYDQDNRYGRVFFFIPGYTYKNNIHKKTGIAPRGVLDLPRIKQGNKSVPLIPDLRNDENLLISQLHVAFLCLHNRIAEDLLAADQDIQKYDKDEQTLLASLNSVPSEFNDQNMSVSGATEVNLLREYNILISPEEFNTFQLLDPQTKKEIITRVLKTKKLDLLDAIFQRAKEEVIQHYQWVILHDYLPKITGESMLDDLLTKPEFRRSLPTSADGKPMIPIEFSAAAGRFGHSMVMGQYAFSSIKANGPTSHSSRQPLFAVKAKQQEIKDYYVNWKLFTGSKAKNNSAQISFFLSENMLIAVPALASLSKNIVYRNFHRGYLKKLWSGQEVARALGYPVLDYDILIAEVINGKEFYIKQDLAILESQLPPAHDFFPDQETHLKALCNNSPLWFYILIEAMVFAHQKHLGPVGGYLVGNTIIQVLKQQTGISIFTSTSQAKPEVPQYFKRHIADRQQNKSGHQRGDDSLITLFQAAGVYHGALTEKEHAT